MSKSTESSGAAIVDAASAAHHAILDDKLPTRERIDAIVLAASSRSRPVAAGGRMYLASIARKFPEGREAILKMSVDSRSHVRFSSVFCLSQALDHQFIRDVLRRALADGSSVVRAGAARMIWSLQFDEIANDLEAALQRESNPKVRAEMALTLEVARHGHYVEDRPDRVGIWIRTSEGMSGRSIPREIADRIGIDVVIATLKRDGIRTKFI